MKKTTTSCNAIWAGRLRLEDGVVGGTPGVVGGVR